MSIARHHAEWLSLVPVSGPFLSLPVLLEAFPQGLDAHDAEHARLLRLAYEEWEDSFARKRFDPAAHEAWIRFVLTKTLEFDETLLAEGQAVPQTLQVEVAEHHELLRPSVVLMDRATQKPRLLIQKYPRSQDLSSYVAGSHWKASPDTRMTELLHGTGVRLGLVTNGEHWMLVDAPKRETTGYASWYATLWLEEKITLRAFRSLLSGPRFFGVADDQTLEALLTKSASNQQEVTTQLGYQVRRAVEVLIHSLDRADQDHGRELLAEVSEAMLYESALTVMMRLVFLFCAEERELIPSKPFPVYEQNYSVSMISKQLREIADQQGEELLERRYDAWPRLLTAFRAVFGGLRHEDVYIPAYGGRLFDPDRFPFLEGRKLNTTWRKTEANPLPVNNRTVLHLLEALQLLQIKVPGGGPAEARRLSFRALDIEQIGHVYEGLLDHTAKRATEPYLGLAGTRDKEPEVPLAELETLLARGEADLVKFLKEETGKSESALKKSLKGELDKHDAARFRTACQSDELWKRVEPLAGLVRPDSFGYPVVIPKGSVFVTAGTDRRSSGTHYTPRSLTEPIVQYTLEPLVYVGPAEGKPKGEWKLKSAKELIELKICDMACGSGAFLVQAARYMAERLMEAWDEAKKAHPDTPGITPEGTPSTGKTNEALIPDDPAERKTYAMRIIAQRCLYGVDINPLAVEMAKLSLWLLTLAKDKPFEFLDHSIRCGDSLVGLHSIDQLRHFSLKPDTDDTVLFKGPLDSAVDEAINLRLKLEDMPANTVEDVQRQEKLLTEANEKIARLRCAADLLVAAEFWGDTAKGKLERIRHAAVRSGHYVEKGPTEEFEQVAGKERRAQLMFHWPLEFPEVMVKRGGFDAFLCNPPFMHGRRVSTTFGTTYLQHLKTFHDKVNASADLVAYFAIRMFLLLRTHSCQGFISTQGIAEGDTRETSLDWMLQNSAAIAIANPDLPWPGTASVRVCTLGIWKDMIPFSPLLSEKPVRHITGLLSADSVEQLPHPEPLAANKPLVFTGTYVYGRGFVLSDAERDNLIALDPRNAERIRPYLRGEDINRSPTLKHDDWVIDFGDLDESEARRWPQLFEHLVKTVKPERAKQTKQVHEPCFWKHWDKRPELYSLLSTMHACLVHAFVGKHIGFAFVDASQVIATPTPVFATESRAFFAVLQSSLHWVWVIERSSKMGASIRYAPSDCFQTYPLPVPLETSTLRFVGKQYEERRQILMTANNEGQTKTYNRFHDPEESAADVQKLRDLQVEMDQAVAAAYGWADLDLGHGFHDTKQGLRFTISESARREVLQRLLKLNHERYAEEVKQGLHGKKGSKGSAQRGRKAKDSPKEASLFSDGDDEPEPEPDSSDETETHEPSSPSSKPQRSSARVTREEDEAEPVSRPTPIGEIETDEVMAAFRQATRNRGSLDRDELLKAVSVILGYQRLGPKIEEALRGHLRAAIRRRIIEADGADFVRAGTGTMADYGLEDLRETFRSVMRKGSNYEREDVVHALARYLGFARVTDTSRDAIKSAINSAIRQGILGYEGSVVWRND